MASRPKDSDCFKVYGSDVDLPVAITAQEIVAVLEREKTALLQFVDTNFPTASTETIGKNGRLMKPRNQRAMRTKRTAPIIVFSF